MNAPEDALAYAKARAASGAQYAVGNCLGFTRDAFSSPATGGSAATAYQATTTRHVDQAPSGYPMWWTGGSKGFGHVAISDGNGNCYSTDFGADKYFGDGRVRLIPQASVAKQSSLIYRGWSEDLDGQLITEAPMILVKKQSVSTVWGYLGNCRLAPSEHQVSRLVSLGAAVHVLPDNDEIFGLPVLNPSPAPTTAGATGTVPAHVHPIGASQTGAAK